MSPDRIFSRSRRHSEKFTRYSKKHNFLNSSQERLNNNNSNSANLQEKLQTNVTKSINYSAHNSPMRIRNSKLLSEEENRPASVGDIPIKTSIIRVFVAFECVGLASGASIRLRILPETTTNEILVLMLEQISQVFFKEKNYKRDYKK